MKKLFLIILPLFLTACFKSEQNNTPIRLAICPDTPPTSFLENGVVIGLEMDILQKTADRLGRELIVETCPFKELFSRVEEGKADLCAGTITITEERAKRVAFSKSYCRTDMIAIARIDKPCRNINDLKTLHLGLKGGTVYEDFCKTHDVPVEKTYKTREEAIEAVNNGEIDVTLMTTVLARAIVRNDSVLAVTSGSLRTSDYAFGAQKNNKEGTALLKEINKTIAELKKSGELEDLLNKWLRYKD